MTSAIVAYPILSEADRWWIESFRTKHDPQSTRLPAHFTLVFPTDATPRLLEAELETAVAQWQPIRFAIRRAEVVRDAVGGGAHVFLTPDDGSAEIAALHDRLYAGMLRPHLRADVPFIPHVTIAAAPDQLAGEYLASELDMGARVVRGTIRAIDLVDVGQPLVRTIRSYPLGITRSGGD
jgi:2'-5' RNA ligase